MREAGQHASLPQHLWGGRQPDRARRDNQDPGNERKDKRAQPTMTPSISNTAHGHRHAPIAFLKILEVRFNCRGDRRFGCPTITPPRALAMWLTLRRSLVDDDRRR